jgi:ribosomal protein S18 acetylase RimI-like enzyme
MGVAPDCRRQGWGVRLLHAFALEARQAGAEYLALRESHVGDRAPRRRLFAAAGLLEVYGDDGHQPFHAAHLDDVLRGGTDA